MNTITSTDILNHIKAEIKAAETDLKSAQSDLHHFSDEDLTNNGLLKPDVRIACLCHDYIAAYNKVKQLKEELRHLQWFCQEQ